VWVPGSFARPWAIIFFMPATRASSCPALTLSVATTVITVVDSFPGRSATFEHRRALLAQRRQRFLVVLALEGDQLERRRGVEGDVERLLHQLFGFELRAGAGRGAAPRRRDSPRASGGRSSRA